MATQLLVNVIRVPAVGDLAPGGSVTLPHGLKSGDAGVVPTQFLPDRAVNIVVSAATDTDVTFTNNDANPASANFRVEYDHSIHAVGVTSMPWQGVVGGGGGAPAGPAGGVLGYPGSTYPDPNGLAPNLAGVIPIAVDGAGTPVEMKLDASGLGSNFYLYAGDGTTNDGGGAALLGGNALPGFIGGAGRLFGGNGGSVGGEIQILAGYATDLGSTGGSVSITAGQGDLLGGQTNIVAGAGTTGTGGNALLFGGDGQLQNGSVFIQPGTDPIATPGVVEINTVGPVGTTTIGVNTFVPGGRGTLRIFSGLEVPPEPAFTVNADPYTLFWNGSVAVAVASTLGLPAVFTLAPAVNEGQILLVINLSGFDLTINSSGVVKVGGGGTRTLQMGGSIMFYADPGLWWREITFNAATTFP